MTSDWLHNYPDSRLLNQPILISDHAAIFFDDSPFIQLSNRPYQLDNWCLEYQDIHDFVLSTWQRNVNGSPMFTLSKNMQHVKSLIRNWCLNNKKFWGIDWKNFTKDLATEGELVQSLADASLYMTKIVTSKESNLLQLQFWRQRCKKNWILKGDCPSKLLFSKVKCQQKKNEISSLLDDQGTLQYGQTDVQSVVVKSLKDTFQCDTMPPYDPEIDVVLRELDLPQLNSSQLANLDRPFSSSEIRTAMFSLGNKVGHLRPIGLCNTVYKCASKCLVARVRHYLPFLISDSQHTFVQGRVMTDNILMSHELMEKINSSKTGTNWLASIKIDMSKAYDRIHWSFLLQFLKAYGFPERWLQMIQQCLATVSYKSLINGTTSETFKPRCGLRQGDPISPYLFLFCMDIFSRMLHLGHDLKLFQGIKLSRRSPTISHLFFADDALIFFRPSSTTCTNIIQIIQRFTKISGEQLNLSKSLIKFSPNICSAAQQGFKSLFHMKHVQVFDHHLGAPIDFVGRKKDHFQFLINKITGRINCLNIIRLSQTQKLIFINSILVAMASHVLACYELPVSVTGKINSLLLRFFWAHSDTKGMHWLLVSKVFSARTTFLSNSPNTGPRYSGRHSYGLWGLLKANTLLNFGCNWKPGDGKSTLAGSAKWVNGSIPEFKPGILMPH
ncbi:uncharacterized protein LOC110690060 [Chenopodium quinoa]|uniref:uncharacterized protein LOC110690060 n=1 Tax=Chenopodium quinoa TaxID=63459 RepID=UPI000B77DD3E|nr:uncharacterized protein LOC110690060 [Chenopodium quinoa]